MKNILILEDDEKRLDQFRANFAGKEVKLFITDDPKQAMSWINDIEFLVIFLDHDLSDEHYHDFDGHLGQDNTGSGFTKWIRESVEEQTPGTKKLVDTQPTFIVHSLNPNGRVRMMSDLEKAGFQPYEFPLVWQRRNFQRINFNL
jgi:hypothetical protein